MRPELETVWRLTEPKLPMSQRQNALRKYAAEHGWQPSDEITEYLGTEEIANGHLLVEHGLDNTAVITFLRTTHPFTHLSWSEQNRLLSISYNNLVDWHLFPDRNGLLLVYNRTQPAFHRYLTLQDRPDAWRAEAFDQLVGRRPNPNLPALDDALIRTVSRWKRLLAAELALATSTGPIAELFNAIFFVRALEDDRRKREFNTRRLLLDVLEDSTNDGTVRAAIHNALTALAAPDVPAGLLDNDALRRFDALDAETAHDLFASFYENSFAPYEYDFSLMSKHALSRVYEHYISVLKERPDTQPTLFGFPDVPDEIANRQIGGIYTPQYIARFFARFLKQNHTPPRFRALRVADPACGSGIFLRTLLEMQCDPLDDINVDATARTAFAHVLGIDVEENACKATRLSLTLLHLVLTGQFPATLPHIVHAEAMQYLIDHPDLKNSFDAVIANPPYVKWERIPDKWQPIVQQFLGGLEVGRADLYLAFVKWALDCMRPGGFMLFVLPHAFLVAKNSEKLRNEILRTCWVRFLADLSDVNVFEDASSYPILLIIEKRSAHAAEPDIVVVRCTAFAGHALQDAVQGRFRTTPHYTIYNAPQSSLQSDNWRVLSKEESHLRAKIMRFPALEEFLSVRQGMNTGMDEVFIRDKTVVEANESAAYVPLLTDREMRKYKVPAETKKVVFYPFDGDRLLAEDEVRDRFPETWKYLESCYERLAARRYAQENPSYWWKPERPRQPSIMLRPKIVTPHLVLFPRFSLDSSGQYAVSRAPFLFPRARGNEREVMKYFLAVLNSTVGQWQLATQSHKYSRGYARLEKITLLRFSAPSPGTVPPRSMIRIQSLIDELIVEPGLRHLEEELDWLIAELYGVDAKELEEVSFGSEESVSHE